MKQLDETIETPGGWPIKWRTWNMLKMLWCCLDIEGEEQNFVSESLAELINLLKKSPSTIELKAEPLPPDLVEVVDGVYEGRRNYEVTSHGSKTRIVSWRWELGFAFYCRYIRAGLDPLNPERAPLLIYCKAESDLAKAAKKENRLAEWGLMNDHYLVSVVYKPNNKYILWHEALHLFEAGDCYCYANPNAGTTCELTNCIMQYAPTAKNIGKWPFLCEKNIKRIQACSEKRLNRTI